jgi:hypothetical protein
VDDTIHPTLKTGVPLSFKMMLGKPVLLKQNPVSVYVTSTTRTVGLSPESLTEARLDHVASQLLEFRRRLHHAEGPRAEVARQGARINHRLAQHGNNCKVLGLYISIMFSVCNYIAICIPKRNPVYCLTSCYTIAVTVYVIFGQT